MPIAPKKNVKNLLTGTPTMKPSAETGQAAPPHSSGKIGAARAAQLTSVTASEEGKPRPQSSPVCGKRSVVRSAGSISKRQRQLACIWTQVATKRNSKPEMMKTKKADRMRTKEANMRKTKKWVDVQ